MKTRQYTRLQRAMKTKIQDLDDHTFNEIACKLNTVHTDIDNLDYELSNSHLKSPQNIGYSETCEKIPELSIEKGKHCPRTGNGRTKTIPKTYSIDIANQGCKAEKDNTINRINNQFVESNFLEFDKHPVKRRNRTVKFNPKTKIFKCTFGSCHMNFTSYDELSRHFESCKNSSECNTDNTGTTSDCNSIKSGTTLDSNTDNERYEYYAGKLEKSVVSTECYTGKNMDKFECKECGQKFWSEHYFHVHNNTHHSAAVTLISCSVCNKKMCSNFELNQHMKRHKNMCWIKCEFCENKFNNIEHLQDHMKIHAAFSPYRCEVCKMRFSSVIELESHVAQHERDIKDGEIETPVACPLCRKDFTSKKEFDVHILTHIGVYPFKCHVCDAGFNRDEHLQVHIMSVHNSVHNSVPGNSSRMDTTKDNCTNNIAAHKNVKRYKCHICGDKICDSRSFQKHLKLHKRYRRSKQLRHKRFKEFRDHYRSRIPDFSSSSSQSDDSSRESLDEQGYIKTHSSKPLVRRVQNKPDMPFDCPFCDQSFRKYKYLKRHLLSHSIAENIKTSNTNAESLIEKNSGHDSCVRIQKLGTRRGIIDGLQQITSAEICGSCVACGINFTQFQDLELHLVTFHSNGMEKFSGSHQNISNHKIKEQEDTALGVKDTITNHECDICDMRFKTDEELKDHITSHFENKHVAIDVSNEIYKRMSKYDDTTDNNPLSRDCDTYLENSYDNTLLLKRTKENTIDTMCEKPMKFVKYEPSSLGGNEIEKPREKKDIKVETNQTHGEHSEIDSVYSPRETNSVTFSPRGKFMSDTDSGFSEKTNLVSDAESVYSPVGIDVNATHVDKQSNISTNIYSHSVQGAVCSENLNVQNNNMTINRITTLDQDSQYKQYLSTAPTTLSSQSQNTFAQPHLHLSEVKPPRVPFLLNARGRTAQEKHKGGVNFHVLGRLK